MSNPQASLCRSCGDPLKQLFADLGMSPLCQTQIRAEALNAVEHFYPLRVHVCNSCYLVQLDEYVSPDGIFSEYAYFSSYSDSWVAHAKDYCGAMRKRLGLTADSLVVEIASNDGYLLQHFVDMQIPVLGIEPAANVAKDAEKRGVRTEVEFLGADTARRLVSKYAQADLVVGNNVLAHVPDINDFVAGIRLLLKDDGVVTMEFPHLVKLMELNQFDTIYHEHFSYLSWYSVQQVFARAGLTLFDVEELPTHGGSLRVFARHHADTSKPVTEAAKAMQQRELDWGISSSDRYTEFAEKVTATKRALLAFLIQQRDAGKTIVGYGAPGKGNTLLNYCGIRTDFLQYTVDRNPYKQGTFTPGTHIPIHDPARIAETRPDYVLVLPWNLREELSEQLAYIKDWGGRLVFPIPELEIV